MLPRLSRTVNRPERPPAEAVHAAPGGVALLPASLRLAEFEETAARALEPERALAKALGGARGDYDVVLLDCPPRVDGVLAANALGASDVAVPQVMDRSILWALIAGLCVAEWVYRRSLRIRQSLEGACMPAIAGRYALFAAIVVSTGVSQLDGARPFIYFQF